MPVSVVGSQSPSDIASAGLQRCAVEVCHAIARRASAVKNAGAFLKVNDETFSDFAFPSILTKSRSPYPIAAISRGRDAACIRVQAPSDKS